MSAARLGSHLANEARDVTTQMRGGMVTAPAKEAGVQGGAQAVQFERKFDAKDKYDDEMNMKMQMMDDKGMTPFGQVYYDDKVGRWIERKEAAVEAANFDSYFNTNFNLNDLASRQWAQSINPEFYQSRETEMTQKADVILRLKKIQLRGPQDKDDLYMLWLIESGRVQLPENWDQLGPGYNSTTMSNKRDAANQASLHSGLIRFPKFLVQEQRDNRAAGNKAAGAWGNQNAARNEFGSTGQLLRASNNQPLSQADKSLGFKFTNFLKQ